MLPIKTILKNSSGSLKMRIRILNSHSDANPNANPFFGHFDTTEVVISNISHHEMQSLMCA